MDKIVKTRYGKVEGFEENGLIKYLEFRMQPSWSDRSAGRERGNVLNGMECSQKKNTDR